MKTFKLLLTLSALTLFFIACGHTTGTNQNRDADLKASPAPSLSPIGQPKAAAAGLSAAHELYDKFCAACHQSDGEGGNIKAKGLTLKVPSLRAGRAVTDSDEKLSKQIADGGEGMPAFKDRLTQEEIANLTFFIREGLQAGAK